MREQIKHTWRFPLVCVLQIRTGFKTCVWCQWVNNTVICEMYLVTNLQCVFTFVIPRKTFYSSISPLLLQRNGNHEGLGGRWRVLWVHLLSSGLQNEDIVKREMSCEFAMNRWLKMNYDVYFCKQNGKCLVFDKTYLLLNLSP